MLTTFGSEESTGFQRDVNLANREFGDIVERRKVVQVRPRDVGGEVTETFDGFL